MAKFKQIIIVFPIIVGILIPGLFSNHPFVSSEQSASYYYLFRWAWVTTPDAFDYWGVPYIDKAVT